MFRKLVLCGRGLVRCRAGVTKNRSCYTTGPNTTTRGRIERLEARLPRFLRGFTTPLRDAPVSHITAFLVLHELTAVVPLFGLAAFFHYADWLPSQLTGNRYVEEGTRRFGKWLRKRGWITVAEEEEAEGGGRGEDLHGGVRVVLELATAYAVTKALLPVRLVGSVWFTPWFARWTVVPLTSVMRRVTGRGAVGKAGATPASAAGAGAVAGGAVPRESVPKGK